MKGVLSDKINSLHNCSYNHTSRYCNQNNFNVLTCGGFGTKRATCVANVHKADASNPESVNVLSLMITEKKQFETCCLKGEVYVIGGRDSADNL